MVLFKAKLMEIEGSLGVIIPTETAREAGFVKGQEVTIELKAENPLKAAFGMLKGWEIDAQKAKDELRKEWSRW